jgi:signal transduction histidine kinase
MEGVMKRLRAEGSVAADSDLREVPHRQPTIDRRVAEASDRTSLELALHEVAQRQARLQAREELLASIAHDLMSPLSTVTLSARVLSTAALPEKQAAVVRRIADAADQLRMLALDVINETQPVATSERLTLAGMMSDRLLDLAVEAMQPIAEAAGVRLVVGACAEPVALAVDYPRMLRVFTNLIGNAIKFSPPGAPVLMRADAQADGIRFSISDSGPGIASEHLPHLFERFWQLGPRSGQGSFGLGLPIAKRLVEAHGGAIGVTSVQGSGTTFCFTLPRPRCVQPSAAMG